MIKLLLDKGASIEVLTAIGQHPHELLKPGAACSDDILARLFQPDPLLPTVKANAPNDLHRAIQKGNLSAYDVIDYIKQLALNPALLIRSPSGKLPSELVQIKAESLKTNGGAEIPLDLAAYLHFREELHSLNHSAAIKHTRASISLDERDRDIIHIAQSVESLELMNKHCNTTNIVFNKRTVLQSLNILASQIFSISFNLKKQAMTQFHGPVWSNFDISTPSLTYLYTYS